MKSVTVSAPGKIHLMGEHAVVYGKPALLSAIQLRTTVTCSEHKQFAIVSPDPHGLIRYAVDLVCASLKNDIPSIKITVESTIPTGYHLGSSAAVAVAMVGALLYYLTNAWDLEKINALAYEAEKKMHGHPSGGDNTAVTYGGFLLYQKKSEIEKIFKKLSFSLPKIFDRFYLINTGRPKENTGEMVKGVNDRFKLHTSTYNKLFDTNELQVKRIVDALQEADEKTLIDAMQKGEQTLERIGVVSTKVKPLIREIEKAGGAAKILGGGGISDGVGFILSYLHNEERLQSIAMHYGFPIQKAQLGEDGVRIER